jgi:hypothetical protein
MGGVIGVPGAEALGKENQMIEKKGRFIRRKSVVGTIINLIFPLTTHSRKVSKVNNNDRNTRTVIGNIFVKGRVTLNTTKGRTAKGGSVANFNVLDLDRKSEKGEPIYYKAIVFGDYADWLTGFTNDGQPRLYPGKTITIVGRHQTNTFIRDDGSLSTRDEIVVQRVSLDALPMEPEVYAPDEEAPVEVSKSLEHDDELVPA